MANTFELISSVTLGTAAASIDFTSIPSTYTDLVLKVSARTSDASYGQVANLSFNGSTSNFTARTIYGDGGSVASNSTARYGVWVSGSSSTASTFGNGEIYIPNYAGSTNKSYSSDAVTENNGGATTAYAVFISGLWSNTAAINQITLTAGAGNFVQYSNFYLYGVKNA